MEQKDRSKARHRALAELGRRHVEEYRRLYRDHLVLLGGTPVPTDEWVYQEPSGVKAYRDGIDGKPEVPLVPFAQCHATDARHPQNHVLEGTKTCRRCGATIQPGKMGWQAPST